MDTITSVIENNKTYILADFLLEKAPVYSKGARSTRNLVKNKKIPESDFVYARLKNGEWIVNKEEKKSAKFDKIFIKKSVITKIPEIKNSKDEIIKDDKGIEKAPTPYGTYFVRQALLASKLCLHQFIYKLILSL